MKKITFALLCWLGLAIISFAQDPLFSGGTTRALVIGISDYQDERIPDLSYAVEDAHAFAEFLRSPAGGALNDDHLLVFTNEDATTAKFVAALDWLIERSEEGDQVIIYFSGHGDVESKIRTQPGYLLTWDSPYKLYMAGAFPIQGLKDYVSTLSIENKAKITMIIDACRSGKLAGQNVQGSQLTNANLSQQIANEVKLLSCQHNEYSIEGKQWGGGRGAFSFHLINGLYGLADRNKDGEVTLSEIDRYLEDHVTPEVAPLQQIPMAIGSKTNVLSLVDETVLSELQDEAKEIIPQLGDIESKGIQEQVLSGTDSLTRVQYFSFLEALEEKRYFEPVENCADTLYKILSKEPDLQRLHNYMRRMYAVALQEDVQQMLNAFISSTHRNISPDPEMRDDRSGVHVKEMHIMTSRGSRLQARLKRYEKFIKQLDVAMELIGPDHYMYNALGARQMYFQAGFEYMSNGWSEKVLEHLQKGNQYEPDAAFLHLALGIYHYSLADPSEEELETGLNYLKQAMNVSPSWGFPYFVASFYYHRADSLEAEERMLKTAIEYNPNSPFSLRNWGNYCMENERWEEAEETFLKAIEVDSAFVGSYKALFTVYCSTQQTEKALDLIDDIEALDSPEAYFQAGSFHYRLNQKRKAESAFGKFLEASPTPNRYQWVGWEAVVNGDQKAAENYFDKAFQSNPGFSGPLMDRAWIQYSSGDAPKAIETLEEGILDFPEDIELKGLLGFIYFFSGDSLKAQEILYANNMSSLFDGLELLAQGETEYALDAIEWLKITYPQWWVERFLYYPYVKMMIQTGNLDTVYDLFKQPDLFVFNHQLLQNDPDLSSLLEKERFQQLMLRHFPSKPF